MDKLEHGGWKCLGMTGGAGAPWSEGRGLNEAVPRANRDPLRVLTASECLGTPNLAGGGRLLHNSQPWHRSRPPGSVSESPGASLPAGIGAARPSGDISRKQPLSQSPAAALLQPWEELLLPPDLLIRLAGDFIFPFIHNRSRL